MTRKGLFVLRRPGELFAMSEESPSYGAVTPFDVLVNHFEANNFRFQTDPEGKSLQLFITGDCAVYNCRLHLTPDDDLFQARVHCPVSARDIKIRPLVAEVLARANHGMSIGNFDIDMDSGDISYHLGQVIRDRGLDDDTIGGVFSTALSTADRYFPAIMRVMFAGHTPADAVYLSELDVHAVNIDAGQDPPAPAPAPPKPVVKRPRAPRKDPRSTLTSDLPGLFDGIREEEDSSSGRQDRP
jgi:hypothetical protein